MFPNARQSPLALRFAIFRPETKSLFTFCLRFALSLSYRAIGLVWFHNFDGSAVSNDKNGRITKPCCVNRLVSNEGTDCSTATAIALKIKKKKLVKSQMHPLNCLFCGQNLKIQICLMREKSGFTYFLVKFISVRNRNGVYFILRPTAIKLSNFPFFEKFGYFWDKKYQEICQDSVTWIASRLPVIDQS